MAGLPALLLKELRQILLECGPFQSDRALAAVFAADDRLAPWRYSLPEAYGRSDRVSQFIAAFLSRQNREGQNVLVLFLQALYDQAIEEDACHQRLNDVAIKVADATGSALPPLARGNLWRASAAREEETLPANLAGYALPPAETEPGAQVAVLPSGLSASLFKERLESLKDKKKADWLPVEFLEKGLQAAYAVGRVEHHNRRIGTAFLIAPDLVLTNAHVVEAIPALKQGGVRFHVGLQTAPQWCYFSEQIAHSAIDELDFALVRLQSSVAGAQPVTFSTETAYSDQPANILQYPDMAGGLMQVALRYNAIVHVDATRIYYVTDTEHGSSGSPVFDDDWRVIALHRAGIVDDAQCPVKNANQGVPLTAIEPFIRSYLQ
jgi:hypothetical protein